MTWACGVLHCVCCIALTVYTLTMGNRSACLKQTCYRSWGITETLWAALCALQAFNAGHERQKHITGQWRAVLPPLWEKHLADYRKVKWKLPQKQSERAREWLQTWLDTFCCFFIEKNAARFDVRNIYIYIFFLSWEHDSDFEISHTEITKLLIRLAYPCSTHQSID